MLNEQKTHSPIEAIRQWYRGLIRSQSTLAECGAEGLERMAHDIGVSGAELHRLASRAPESADLLCRRMEVLDLDENEVARRARHVPGSAAGLQHVRLQEALRPRSCAQSRRPGLEGLLSECADADRTEHAALDRAAGVVI